MVRAGVTVPEQTPPDVPVAIGVFPPPPVVLVAGPPPAPTLAPVGRPLVTGVSHAVGDVVGDETEDGFPRTTPLRPWDDHDTGREKVQSP